MSDKSRSRRQRLRALALLSPLLATSDAFGANEVNDKICPGVIGGAFSTCNSVTSTLTDRLVFNPPVVTTTRTDAFSTRIIGRLVGGTVFNEVFAAPYQDALVQAGVARAQLAITTAGGPAVVLAAPMRTSRTETVSSATTASVYSFNRKEEVFTLTELIGPTSTFVTFVSNEQTPNVTGGGCQFVPAQLPSTVRPVCTPDVRLPVTVVSGSTNLDVGLETTYYIDETRSVLETRLISEEWLVEGTIVSIGTIHAQAQSGLFDLGDRLLGDLTVAPAGGAAWGDVYGFTVDHGGEREAWGAAAGVGLALGDNFTLSLGAGHGRLDLDVPGASESGTLELTQIGAALRYDSGPFSASVAAIYGAGSAETLRTMLTRAAASYDVQLTGIAVEAGYTFTTGAWSVRPVAGLDRLHLTTDGFTESGALGLIAGERDIDRTRAWAGVEVARDLGGVTAEASLRYIAIIDGEDRGLPVAFAAAPRARSP